MKISEERLQRRIGVYGGTFDPIHNGHFKVAEAILKAFAMEQMLFVPAYVPPHKRGQEISSPFHRMAMLALATADSPEMFVSDIELEAPSRPYTIETLGRLQTEHPDGRLLFVMGADSFQDIILWREYERILTNYDVVVATRPGQYGFLDETRPGAHLAPSLQSRIVDLRGGQMPERELPAAARIYLTDYVEVDVSATTVRKFANEGRRIGHFVPNVVADYISKYRLYR